MRFGKTLLKAIMFINKYEHSRALALGRLSIQISSARACPVCLTLKSSLFILPPFEKIPATRGGGNKSARRHRRLNSAPPSPSLTPEDRKSYVTSD